MTTAQELHEKAAMAETPPPPPENAISAPRPAPPPPARPDPSQGTEGQRERLQTCLAALQELLTTHRCQIMPRLGQVIPVGTTGDTIQVQATWDLGALPDQP